MLTVVVANHKSSMFCSQTFQFLKSCKICLRAVILSLPAGWHQLERITNRTSEAPASNLASCCREFRDHESDIRGELGDLRGLPRLRPDWPSYLRMMTNGSARTRSLNLRQSLGDSVQEAA